MIRGVTREAVPYIPEAERGLKEEEQTVFYIVPKKGRDLNKSVQRYARASRDGRRGFREIDAARLDAADVEEFLETVQKIQNYAFSEEYKKFWPNQEGEVCECIKEIDEESALKAVCRDLPANILSEIFDAANDISKLTEGEKKS